MYYLVSIFVPRAGKVCEQSSYEVWVWVLGKIMNSLISFHKNYLVLAFVIWCLHRRIYCVIWKMHQAIRSRTGPESVIDWKYLAKSFSSCAFLYLLTERWSLSEVLREDFGFCLQVYLLSYGMMMGKVNYFWKLCSQSWYYYDKSRSSHVIT